MTALLLSACLALRQGSEFQEELLLTYPPDVGLGDGDVTHDARAVAFVLRTGRGEYLLTRDGKGKMFDRIRRPRFAPDGGKVRFVVFYPRKREFWRKVMEVD